MYIRTILYTMVSVGSLVAADRSPRIAMTSQAQSSSSTPVVALISMPEKAEDPKVLITQAQQFKFSFDYPRNIVELTKLKRTIVDNKVLEFCDNDGDTLLHRAVNARDGSSTELLLSWGADVNARNTKTGRTALHTVKTVAMLEKLLAYGADPDAMNINGAIPYEERHLDIPQDIIEMHKQATEATLRQFCRQTTPSSLLQQCIWKICASKVDTKVLPVALQTNITAHQRWLNRKLHTHLLDRSPGYLENLKILLSRGADPNSFYLYRRERPIERLIERIFPKNNNEDPAIDSTDVLDILLDVGMDPNVRETLFSELGNPCLHLLMHAGMHAYYFARPYSDAVHTCYRYMVTRLCARGADVTLKNLRGATLEQLFRNSWHAKDLKGFADSQRFKAVWQEVGVSLSVDENVDGSAPSCSSSDIHTPLLPVDHAEHN